MAGRESVRAAAEMRQALKLQRESQFVIDTPMQFTPDGNLKMTCLGADETIERLFENASDIEYATFELLEAGYFDPDESPFDRMLTA